MDMKKLYKDFQEYVKNMTKEDTKNNIKEAIEHSKNSFKEKE